MIHVEVFQNATTTINATTVQSQKLSTPTLGPFGTPNTELKLDGLNPAKLVDLSAETSAQGVIAISNEASFKIFWCFGTPGTPNLTTGNGVSIPASPGYLTLDAVAGLCVWAISGTPQTTGAGTRITTAAL